VIDITYLYFWDCGGFYLVFSNETAVAMANIFNKA
jgi:hypothetical protein